jgi:hypothetical protein
LDSGLFGITCGVEIKRKYVTSINRYMTDGLSKYLRYMFLGSLLEN